MATLECFPFDLDIQLQIVGVGCHVGRFSTPLTVRAVPPAPLSSWLPSGRYSVNCRQLQLSATRLSFAHLIGIPKPRSKGDNHSALSSPCRRLPPAVLDPHDIIVTPSTSYQQIASQNQLLKLRSSLAYGRSGTSHSETRHCFRAVYSLCDLLCMSGAPIFFIS